MAASKLWPGSPRDLQTICMKCLEKNPRRRFSSAAVLADELGRFLRCKPIHIRAAASFERLGRWVKRQPYQAALAVVAVVALIGAFGGLLVRQARLRVEISRTAQAVEYAHTQKVLADGNYKEARTTIQAMLDCYNELQFSKSPRRGELQRAQAEQALGFKEAASALFELTRAVADAETLVRRNPESVEARSDLAWRLHDLGSVLIECGGLQGALSAHRSAIEINRALSDGRPDDLPRRAALAENLNNFGLVTVMTDVTVAEQAYSEAAKILEGGIRQSSNRRWVTSLRLVLYKLGNLAKGQGNTDRAFRCSERGLALLDDALEREPAQTELRYNALSLHGFRANLLASLGRHSEAVLDLDEVEELSDDPADRVGFRFMRILQLVRTDNYARGVAEVIAVSQAQFDSRADRFADLYTYACIFG
jgi:eukaryotic-like serine/threonine-protein kinase